MGRASWLLLLDAASPKNNCIPPPAAPANVARQTLAEPAGAVAILTHLATTAQLVPRLGSRGFEVIIPLEHAAARERREAGARVTMHNHAH